MNDNAGRLDAIEDALVELSTAEQARVFDRTRIDPGELLKVDPAERLPAVRRGALRWVPVAAAIGMVAFVGTSMLTPQVERSPQLSSVADGVGVGGQGKGCAAIVECRTGPMQVVLADACLAYDYDGDSDVDMADWRTHILNCGRGTTAVH